MSYTNDTTVMKKSYSLSGNNTGYLKRRSITDNQIKPASSNIKIKELIRSRNERHIRNNCITNIDKSKIKLKNLSNCDVTFSINKSQEKPNKKYSLPHLQNLIKRKLKNNSNAIRL
mmetsp:Transcript_5500/g.4691  ORF Transcript_5500/g.4691 Transcript_5500/m.4691 type:complete len:116 (-) Transcript_5500:594-941(-)